MTLLERSMSAFAEIVEGATSSRRQRRLKRAYSVDDVRAVARRSVPKMVFDFVDGGAEDEFTMRGNRAAFDRWGLVPRPFVDVGERDQSVCLLGRRQTSPMILAPAGLAGLAWPYGEAAAAASAARNGVPFTVSSMASVSVEDVRARSEGELWIQLYLWRDRSATEDLVRRCAELGYTTLCLTVDVPLTGQRERDLRNGMTIPPRVGLRNAAGVLSRPGWALRTAVAGVTFANLEQGASSRDTMRLGSYVNSQLNPTVTWSDLAWLRSIWAGQLVVKGVLDPRAIDPMCDAGVDGVVVSNHGGRQLDGAVPAAMALPPIVGAVNRRMIVILDGGVRRGADVVKAVALGADACMFGRPYVFGLAAGGESGVDRVLELLRAEIDRTLALLGVASMADVAAEGRSLLADLG
jgi:L-lactate dehydrogenase (cytochrome)